MSEEGTLTYLVQLSTISQRLAPTENNTAFSQILLPPLRTQSYKIFTGIPKIFLCCINFVYEVVHFCVLYICCRHIPPLFRCVKSHWPYAIYLLMYFADINMKFSIFTVLTLFIKLLLTCGRLNLEVNDWSGGTFKKKTFSSIQHCNSLFLYLHS